MRAYAAQYESLTCIELTIPGTPAADWQHGELDSVDASAFYASVARAGIQYGPAFQMVRKTSGDGRASLLRWDGCFVRLLDGLLQASALDPAGCGYQLRIPTRIRRLAVTAPSPALLPGADGEGAAAVNVCADRPRSAHRPCGACSAGERGPRGRYSVLLPG
jgi:hypothetical protein